eukprot:g115.t1
MAESESLPSAGRKVEEAKVSASPESGSTSYVGVARGATGRQGAAAWLCGGECFAGWQRETARKGSPCATEALGWAEGAMGRLHGAVSRSSLHALVTESYMEQMSTSLALHISRLKALQTSGSLQLDLDTTPGGFPVVLQTRSFDSETEGQLVIRHAAEDKVDVVNMRQPLASLSHSQWLEKAFQKHRYRSETVKIWPAIEFMMAMANQLFPLAQRAFYLSVGNLSQSGGEFAAAARAARQLRCPIILGDVENEDLFDPLGALEVTREDSWWVRLGGPLVRPHTGGVDLIEALKHVFAGTTKPGTGARIGAIYLALLVYGFYLDEKASPTCRSHVWRLFLVT